jgi:hypothetical protein
LQSAGLSPANWIRVKVFSGRFSAEKNSPIEAALYLELRKIGVNLNQAVKLVNSYRARVIPVSILNEKKYKLTPLISSRQAPEWTVIKNELELVKGKNKPSTKQKLQSLISMLTANKTTTEKFIKAFESSSTPERFFP